jgi:hypothetical protein
MKAEDVARMWNESAARMPADSRPPLWDELQYFINRKAVAAFAEIVASEERAAVVKMAKEHARACVEMDGIRGRVWVDWSAFDAAVKERADAK